MQSTKCSDGSQWVRHTPLLVVCFQSCGCCYCVWLMKRTYSKKWKAPKVCVFSCETTIQASVPSDTEATAKVAKTQLKLRPRNYKHKPAGNIWLTPQSPVLHVSDSSNHTNLSYTCWYEHLWEILQLHLKLCNLHMVWLRVCDKKKKSDSSFLCTYCLCYLRSVLLIGIEISCTINQHPVCDYFSLWVLKTIPFSSVIQSYSVEFDEMNGCVWRSPLVPVEGSVAQQSSPISLLKVSWPQ